MKKFIFILLAVFLLGCGTTSISLVDDSKALTELTDKELSLAVERNYQLSMSDGRTTGTTANGIATIVFQNEQLRRLIEELVSHENKNP